VLTETKFKEFYEQAERLRASPGGHAAAGELLLFLFDHGRQVGGYGVVRLTFVLRDLTALADLANPRPEPAAQRIRLALGKRRDAREQLANLGEAGFAELQELVALNRALGEPQRSFTLYQGLHQRSREESAIAEVRRVLSGLILETILPGDAGKIADQYEYERLKRLVLELEQRVTAELANPLPQESEIVRLAAEVKVLCDRHRVHAGRDLPRAEEEKRRVAGLAGEVMEILARHSLAGAPPSGDGVKVRLFRLSRDLAALVAQHEIRADLMRDRDIRNHLMSLAREMAARIAETRIAEDFVPPGAQPSAEHKEAAAARIQHDGLLAYEALLRIGEDVLAQRVGSWMLAFRQNEEMYSSLAAAARRARKPALESRLREEAQRLASG
jgi:hypothetical protein